MKETIRKTLGLDDSSSNVSALIEQTNRGILRYEAVFIAALSLIAVISSFFPIVPWEGLDLAGLTAYRVGLLVAFVASIACNRLCVGLAEQEPDDVIRRTRGLLISYTTVLIVVAIVLTVIDYPRTGSFFLYAVALVLIFGLLYIAPIATLIIIVMYTAVLGATLTAMGEASPTMAFSLVAYAFVAVVISMSNYQTRLRATIASEEALSLSRYDPLTGLPSMMYFLVQARSMLNSSKLADQQFYLVYFNIENMKVYNERFGMTAGDELLVFTARTIQDAFEGAEVARVGDDRFALIDHGNDPVRGIKRVHEAVRAHDDEVATIIRAGVYAYEDGVDVSAACDLAKLACDHIKGRHDMFYYRYDARLHEARERRQFILDRFEDALAKGHVRPYYQPIMRSIGGRVSELEALSRWIDPEHGFISPGDFIPALEEYRLVHLLDLHIIRCVCRDISALADEGLHPVPVNVNLSRYDLELCDIVGETSAIMAEYGISADMLNIEITESAFSENTDLLAKTIERFHDRGMSVWMDDFGSGYSSLNVLREFRFDVVKFDMGFLRYTDEEGRSRSRKMIPHLVNMAKELGLQTLIEGIEDVAQRDFLREAGIEKLQGFAFGKPGPVQDMRALLAKGADGIEMLDERGYYDLVGQVNLSAPVDIDPDLAHALELSSGLPAAIVEFRDGRVSYLHWNSSYIDYLHDIGMHTIENSTAQMNDLSRPQSQGFFQAAEHLRGKPEWLNLSFQEGDEMCTGMARCVAVDETSGATAFLYIAYNVTRYLARAGLAPSNHADGPAGN